MSEETKEKKSITEWFANFIWDTFFSDEFKEAQEGKKEHGN